MNSREVVDHDWDWGSVEDSLEEAKDGLSVTAHSEGKVAYSVSLLCPESGSLSFGIATYLGR